MKPQTRVIIIAVLAFLISLPLSVIAQNPLGLEVSDPQWTYDAYDRFRPRSAASARVDIGSAVTTPGVQEISALFRNTGSKTIKSVAWEYILFKDAKETHIQRIYTSRNEMVIPPGESIRLRKSGFGLQHSQYVKIRVTRIAYMDGTLWQGTKTKR